MKTLSSSCPDVAQGPAEMVLPVWAVRWKPPQPSPGLQEEDTLQLTGLRLCFNGLGAVAKHLPFITIELGLWEQWSLAWVLSALESQFG